MQVENPEQLQLSLASTSETTENSSENALAENIEETKPVEAEQNVDQPPAPSSQKREWLAWLLGLLVLGGLGWLVYSRIILSQQPQFQPGGPVPVQITSPKTSTIRDSSEYLATLTSRQAIQVQPQVQGRVTQILVNPGDRVQAGTPLIQLDGAEQQAEVFGNQAGIDAASADLVAARADADAAKRSLDAIKANRRARQSDLAFSQKEYQRFKTLFEKGATTRQSLDEKRNAFQQAQANLAQIDADINAQTAAIERAQANIIRAREQRGQAIANANQSQVQLRYYTITAPISGIVGDIPVKDGDLVEPSTALLNLSQNQQVEIQLQIPQEQSEQLEVGLPVELVGQTGNVQKTGRIFFVATNVNSQTQSVQTKAVFNNADGSLRANQMVRARVIWANRSGILVPTTAISRVAGQNFVFTAVPPSQASCESSPPGGPGGPPPGAGNGTDNPNPLVAQQKPVQLGRIIGNSQEVLKGITRSDRILTSGLLQLQDCTPIQDAKNMPPGPF